MEVLITGGLGLIGSALAARLQSSDHQIHLVDSLDPRAGGSFGNLPSSLAGATTVASISDPGIWKHLPNQLDVVINLAGLSGHSYSMRQPQDDLFANVIEQASFLKELVNRGNQPHVILASTRQVYGVDPGRFPGAIRPADVNAVGQHACEQLHEVLLRGSQGRVTVLRLSNVYGSAMLRATTPQGILGDWLQSAVQGHDLRVTLPSPVRDLLHVEDLVDLILLMIQAEPADSSMEVYDVGGGIPVPLTEVAKHLASTSGSSIVFSALSAEESRVAVQDYTTELARVSDRFGWTPSRDWRLETSSIVREATA